MAKIIMKDDYGVIVYKILKYLYKCLKTGSRVDLDYLSMEQYDIPESYWKYIFKNLQTSGLVTGVTIKNVLGAADNPQISIGKDIMLTPEGIEYLEDNSLMKKAASALSSVSELAAFWL